MINFRYHIVSLISVFFALAVGIALGAGPLKGPINQSLDDQVAGLRAEKDELRGNLTGVEATSAYREAVLTDVLDTAVTGLLPGQSVAVVTIGGGSADQIDQVTQALAAAGADVTAELELTTAWWDSSPERLDQATEDLPGSTAADSPTRLARALFASLTPQIAGEGIAHPYPEVSAPPANPTAVANLAQTAITTLTHLRDVGLIKGRLPEVGATALIVLISQSLDRGDLNADDEARDLALDQAASTLVRAAATRFSAVVVAGSADGDANLLVHLRDDSQLRQMVSTVDGPGQSALSLLAVRALAAELTGRSGHYGQRAAAIGGAAVAPYRPVPSPAPTFTPEHGGLAW